LNCLSVFIYITFKNEGNFFGFLFHFSSRLITFQQLFIRLIDTKVSEKHSLPPSRWKVLVSPKHWYLHKNLHGVITRKNTVIFVPSSFLQRNFLEVITVDKYTAQPVQYPTTGWTTGVFSPVEAKDFSSSLCIQAISETHPASCTMGTGGHSEGNVQLGRDAGHSPPSSASVKNK
jgi:hypothetical protein